MRSYVIPDRLPPKGFLSKSKIARFRRCPEAFRRIRDGEPDFQWNDDEDAEDLSEVGILYHRTVEIEFETRKAEGRLDEIPDDDELIDTLKLAAIRGSESLVDLRTVERTEEILRDSACNLSFKGGVGAEIPFKLQLYSERDFVGIFDLVREKVTTDGRTIELVDWKTGWNVLDEDQARRNVQVAAYLAAGKRLWPDADVRFVLEYVAAGGRTVVSWTKALDDTIMAYLRDVVHRIDANNEAEKQLKERSEALHQPLSDPTVWPARVGQHCASCGFRTSCKAYDEFVTRFGYEPRPPFANLPVEEIAREAIVAKTVETLFEKRRKDAYAMINERMGGQRRASFHGYDFTKVRKPKRAPIRPDDALHILVDNGVPLPQAAEAVKQNVIRYFDEECIDDFAKYQPRGWKGRVKKLIQDTRVVLGLSEHLEARESDGGAY